VSYIVGKLLNAKTQSSQDWSLNPFIQIVYGKLADGGKIRNFFDHFGKKIISFFFPPNFCPFSRGRLLTADECRLTGF
jgi:hypothetical protein